MSSPPIERLIFGAAEFEPHEEYLAFQYRLLCVLMVAGALSTMVFVVAAVAGTNPMDGTHLNMMMVFSAVTLVLYALLRNHKQRFRPVARSYLLLCMVEFTSALVNVSADELRVLWFFINIPGCYLLLGRRVGLSVTLVTVVGLVLGNPFLHRPYSPNAVMTMSVVLLYLALFFHVYQARSVSYFQRMRRYNDELFKQATRDPLTGAYNARAYYEASDRWLAGAQRRGAQASVLFIDLDHFKRINDTRGHAAGDAVLKAVADCMAKQLRQGDLLGRIGGEEFSVLLPDTPADAAAAVAEKLRQSLEQLTLLVDGGPLQVTASIGVASAAGDDVTMAALQREADQAMYRAKAEGRNRVSRLAPGLCPVV